MKTTKLWNTMLIIASVFMFTGCGDDDKPVIKKTEGLRLANGFYMKKSDAEPLAVNKFVAEKVEGEGFKAIDREGFIGNYMFLKKGSYQMVEVKDKKITTTMGGAATTAESADSDCELKNVTVVALKAGGAAVSITSDGIYKVTYDKTFSEMVIYKIEKAVVIGDATEGGGAHNEKQVLKATGVPTADKGVNYKIENLVLRTTGSFKIRFNCAWKIKRNDASRGQKGYISFTNLGGTITNLEQGGNNMKVAKSGKYTVELKWTPKDGFKVTLTRTGDAPKINFDPNNFKWGILGDATIKGWDEDRDMFYKKEGKIHTWYSVITLKGTGKFKFRTNDSWDTDLGGTLTTNSSKLTRKGSDINTPGAGDFYIVLYTDDEGQTWKATISEAGWGLIGEGSPQGNWDADKDMMPALGDNGITTYTLQGNFTDKDWKFRAGDDWKYNLGGTLDKLAVDGPNLKLSKAGEYKVVLSFDGKKYSLKVTEI